MWLQTRWIIYALHWLILIIILACGGLVFRNNRYKSCLFDITDRSIYYPTVDREAVSVLSLAFGAFTLPSATIILGSVSGYAVVAMQTSTTASKHRLIWEIHTSLLGLYMVLGIVQLFNSICWALICKPRPDFMDLCLPDLRHINKYLVSQSAFWIQTGLGSHVQQLDVPIIVDSRICQNVSKTGYSLHFSAFPSGHVDFAVSCSTYTALWLRKRYNLGSRLLHYSLAMEQSYTTTRTGTENRFLRVIKRIGRGIMLALFASTPGRPSLAGLVQILLGFSLSIYVAHTRYAEYRHDFVTIVFSALFGALIAWLGFWLYNSAEYPVTAEDEEEKTPTPVETLPMGTLPV